MTQSRGGWRGGALLPRPSPHSPPLQAGPWSPGLRDEGVVRHACFSGAQACLPGRSQTTPHGPRVGGCSLGCGWKTAGNLTPRGADAPGLSSHSQVAHSSPCRGGTSDLPPPGGHLWPLGLCSDQTEDRLVSHSPVSSAPRPASSPAA